MRHSLQAIGGKRKIMATKPQTPNPNGRKGDPVSIAPLSVDEFVDGMFKIKPEDVKRIVASKPGKKQAKPK
jgi:hypothetical protein